MYERIRQAIPGPVKNVLRPIYKQMKRYKFWFKYKFPPPPEGTDLSGYDMLLDFIIEQKILDLRGDLLEIGAFLGGGTYKLCKLVEKKAPAKKVFVVDIFDPDFDATKCIAGVEMRQLYRRVLEKYGSKSQEEVFKLVTRTCINLVVIKGDSKQVTLPCRELCFAFIDGNHDPSYVENDFYLVWHRLVNGGAVAFDDYGFDLPQVTSTIDRLIERHRSEIMNIQHLGRKIIVLIKGGLK